MKTPRRCRGFTLIELLIVIFILGILVALVVGAASYVFEEANRKNTAATQAILMDAIQTFFDENGNYPTENGASEEVRIHNLYLVLTTCNASMAKLHNLPLDAVDTSNEWFMDAYENYMDYRITGGIGGRPVIISRGRDDTFGTEDDIRSDR